MADVKLTRWLVGAAIAVTKLLMLARVIRFAGHSVDFILAGNHATVEHDLSKQVISSRISHLKKAFLDPVVLNCR